MANEWHMACNSTEKEVQETSCIIFLLLSSDPGCTNTDKSLITDNIPLICEGVWISFCISGSAIESILVIGLDRRLNWEGVN